MRVNDKFSLLMAGVISVGTIFGVVGLSGVKKDSKSQNDVLEGGRPSMKPSDFK